MILNQVKPNIEMSSDMEGVQFSIGDQTIIFDILRSKMYSDPIAAICREISANARDSHIEAGKSETPIEIGLPSSFDPNFRIRDFGVGLSPERIETIYSKVGISTKREDNRMVGCFGIGKLSCHSYSSDFSIISIYNGIKYHYACIIDTTKLGKVVKLNEEATTECNGVEIIVPVKSTDFNAFKTKTEHACRHWDITPIIKGGIIDFKKPTFSLSGEGWGIDQTAYSLDGRVRLIISGFEYPLNLNEFKSPSAEVLNEVSGITYLYFETGELSLSANREQIHLDQPTIDKISNKLDVITQSFKEKVQIKIDACSNLWEANCYKHGALYNTFSEPAFLGTLQWQGIDLCNLAYLPFTSAEVAGQEFSRYSSHASYSTLKPANLYLRNYNSFRFDNGTKLVFNDTDKPAATATQVVQLFREDSAVVKVAVFSLKGKTTWKALNKKYHLDKMGSLQLSKLPEYIEKVVPPPPVKKPRLLISRYDLSKRSFKRTSYDAMEEDTNKKVLCLIRKNYYEKQVVLPNDKTMKEYDISSLLEKKSGFSFYAIAETVPKARIKEDLKGFQTLEKFITSNILNDDKISYEEIKYAEGKRYLDTYYMPAVSGKDLLKKIADPKSDLLKMDHLKKYLSELATKQKGKVQLYESLKGTISDNAIAKWIKTNPEKDIVSLDERVRSKYPLLSQIGYNYGAGMQEAMIHYINLMDAGSIKKSANKTNKTKET
jgi:Histidine kinase-, DNA gyrase B-, and HSP90-like ATPase